MDKITSLIENTIAPPLTRLANTRYLQMVQKAFMSLMPLLIFSSLLILVAALPIPGWEGIVAPIVDDLWGGVNSTLGFLAVGLAITSGYHLGEFYRDKGSNISSIATTLMSFICFMIFFPMITLDNGMVVINAANFGSTGIFSSIFISIVVVEVYRFFVDHNFTIKLPDGVPPMVLEAFTALIPSSIVMLVSWLISQVLLIDLPVLLNQAFAPLIMAGKGPIPQFLSFFVDRLLWFTGIHGSGVASSVMQPIWTQMITENMEAYKAGASVIPNLFTAEWCNYFVRVSVFPIAFLAARSKISSYKTIGKLAIPASIFNIGEPILFGLPIVLNPILFVPWVIGFSFVWIWAYIFTALIPLIPPVIVQVAWTVPAPIAAYLSTGGSWIAFLFSCFSYILVGLIFYPFFKVLERQEMARQEAIEETPREEG